MFDRFFLKLVEKEDEVYLVVVRFWLLCKMFGVEFVGVVFGVVQFDFVEGDIFQDVVKMYMSEVLFKVFVGNW